MIWTRSPPNDIGIEAQAAYKKEHAKEIADARTAYATARALYSTARRQNAPLVAKAREDLDDLVERIRCQLDHDDDERLAGHSLTW